MSDTESDNEDKLIDSILEKMKNSKEKPKENKEEETKDKKNRRADVPNAAVSFRVA